MPLNPSPSSLGHSSRGIISTTELWYGSVIPASVQVLFPPQFSWICNAITKAWNMNPFHCSIHSHSSAKITFFTSLLYAEICLFPKDTTSAAVTWRGPGPLLNTLHVPFQKYSRPSCSSLQFADHSCSLLLKSIQFLLFGAYVMRLSSAVSMLPAVRIWFFCFFLSLRSLPPGSWLLSTTTPARILKNFNFYVDNSFNIFAYSSLIFFLLMPMSPPTHSQGHTL